MLDTPLRLLYFAAYNGAVAAAAAPRHYAFTRGGCFRDMAAICRRRKMMRR